MMPQTKSKYPNNPEQTLWITQTKIGNPRAFNHIVEKYQQPLYNLCYRMLNDRDEALEATQEIFTRAYARLDSYDDRHKFSTWLFAIARYYCLDHLKRPRRQLIPWNNLADSYHGSDRNSFQPEEALLEAESAQEVAQLLKILHPHYRRVVILRYWYTMSHKELAQTLNTTVSAIKSRLFRARKLLAEAAT